MAAPGLWFAVTRHVAASPSCPPSAPSASRFRVLTPCCFLVAFSIDASRAYAPGRVVSAVELPPVVVGATLIPTPESELGTSVTVISADEIAARQQRTLPDALLAVPGLNVVQSGGPGGLTSVFIRGANSEPDQSSHRRHRRQRSEFARRRLRFRAYPQLRSRQHRGAARTAKRSLWLRRNRRRHQYRDAKGPWADAGDRKCRGRLVRDLQSDRQSLGLGRLAELFPRISGISRRPIRRLRRRPSFRSAAPINPNAYDNRTFSFRVDAQLADKLDLGLTSRYIETDPSFDERRFPRARRTFEATTATISPSAGPSSITPSSTGVSIRRLASPTRITTGSYFDPNSIPVVPSFYEGIAHQTRLSGQSPPHRGRNAGPWRRARGKPSRQQQSRSGR